VTTYTAVTYPVNSRVRTVAMAGKFAYDYPVVMGGKTISGTVFDTSGTPVSGATVLLFRDSDQFYCASTTSDGSGNYSFTRESSDSNTYYVKAYAVSGGSTQIHGTSDKGLAPV